MVTPVEAIEVKCANEADMRSTSTGALDLEKVPGKKCDKFKNVGTSSIGIKPLDSDRSAIVHHNHQAKAIRQTLNEIVVPGEEVSAGQCCPRNMSCMTDLHDCLSRHRTSLFFCQLTYLLLRRNLLLCAILHILCTLPG